MLYIILAGKIKEVKYYYLLTKWPGNVWLVVESGFSLDLKSCLKEFLKYRIFPPLIKLFFFCKFYIQNYKEDDSDLFKVKERNT